MKDERVLFKFVANEYLHDLLQGKLYMNALSYFLGLETADALRSDEREGQSFCSRMDRSFQCEWTKAIFPSRELLKWPTQWRAL
jgi:hypothetical protein